MRVGSLTRRGLRPLPPRSARLSSSLPCLSALTSTSSPALGRMQSGRSVHFSAGSDESAMQSSFSALAKPNGRWSLSDDDSGLERTFKFKTFKAAWTFMNDVAGECKKHKHHPEWSNLYNQVFVRWTTHNPAGLSEKDVALAKICDEFASRSESLEIDAPAADTDGTLKSVANTLANAAGDCCAGPAAKLREKEKIEAEETQDGAQGSVAGIGGQPS